MYSLQTATLGGNQFANVRRLLEDGEPVGHDTANTTFPVLYRTRGNELSIYLMDEDDAAAAVKAGKIAGEIQGSSVHITADAKVTDAFFASADGTALFSVQLAPFAKVE